MGILQIQMIEQPKLRLLAIGFFPPPIGGVTVSFKTFCETISNNSKVELQVIKLSGIRKNRSGLKKSLDSVKQIWMRAKKCDVVKLYCHTTQVPTIGLTTLAICRILGKPLILRKAGGTDYAELGGFTGWIAAYVVNHSDLFLAQTKHLVELSRSRGLDQTEWYPTSRPAGRLIDSRTRCLRFVYIGHVRPSKGIAELIAAMEHMPSSVIADVYGPFYDGMGEEIFQGHNQIRYRGILQPDEVIDTLRRYDAFVLPSKHLPEGYPGAIIEAFSVGLPVISTTMGGIPEIVDERCGILVEPGDVKALSSAMLRIVTDETVYRNLCLGARDARNKFSAEYWADWLVQQCIRLKEDTEKA